MHPFLTHQTDLTKHTDLAAVNCNSAPVQSGLLQRWARSTIQSWKRRKMIAALHAMDNHLLKDIGINRHDIARVVDGFDDRELRMVPLAPSSNPNRVEADIKQIAA